MTKKRFLAMLLTGAMTLSLAACGGTSTGSDAGTDSGADSGSDSYKIALIQQHQTNAFQIAVSEAAEAKADELGVDLTILSADQDAATQISQIEQCVSEAMMPSCSSLLIRTALLMLQSPQLIPALL